MGGGGGRGPSKLCGHFCIIGGHLDRERSNVRISDGEFWPLDKFWSSRRHCQDRLISPALTRLSSLLYCPRSHFSYTVISPTLSAPSSALRRWHRHLSSAVNIDISPTVSLPTSLLRSQHCHLSYTVNTDIMPTLPAPSSLLHCHYDRLSTWSTPAQSRRHVSNERMRSIHCNNMYICIDHFVNHFNRNQLPIGG
jgi:hypothetical protein